MCPGKPVYLSSGLFFTAIGVDPRRLWRMLLINGYRELPVSSEHSVAVLKLPPLHRDPFNRILVAQVRVARLTLLTVDKLVAKYGEGVRKV
jgi:PIN domain nuclease of toxin-antitoxin system